MAWCSSRTLPGHWDWRSSASAEAESLLGWNAACAAEMCQEFLRELVDVLAAFAKRRKFDRKHGHAVIQILPEHFLLHLIEQSHVGGANHPHIHAKNIRASQALHFSVLQKPQQLGLHRQRKIADFVQEQSSPVSVVDAPDAGLHRAGEGAARVSK